ncbi:Geranylgeranyl transferase type-2 subunit alpha [Cytospora mali]|uniref:Geranylgeranyl transferase type-2 subunit alpha n=1 Tax=Cytospora mali TaxID=578113 RepID=A0A194WBA9_CYTMA|nr:Geranylgeranyl transferase type-2 subunit alpha [Valsa mali]
MASHGVARTNRSRTEEQRQQELEKIQKYRDLEDQVRSHVARKDHTHELFQLTTKLLRLNPEYYTIWNVRRQHLLISGLSCKPSAGSSPSTALQSSSQTATTTTSSAESSSSSSTATQQNPESQTTGRNGTTADNVAEPKPAGEDASAVDEKAKAQKNDLDVLKSELGFTVPLLMEFPKCYWIWKYRSWLLQQAIERLDPAIARRIWEEELGLDTKMLTKDRRNFHAWGYRRNVVKHLESVALNGKSMVEAEFEFTTKMIRVDLSNFSAWHNRSKLIPRLLDERGADEIARKKFFDQEGLNVGPDDQSLWYYHQFLILDLIEYAKRPTITASLSVEERVSYVKREIVDIKDLLEDYDDSKLIYEALIEYTLALSALEKRKPSEEGLVDDLRDWLSQLKQLDPMRKGRWNDMEKDLAVLAG